MDFLYLIFYGCLRLRFQDVETNHGSRRSVPAVCRILCSNVRGLALNLSDLSVASSVYNMLFALRLWFQICVTCRRCWFPVSVALYRGKMHRAREVAAYVRDGYGAIRQPKFECSCCKMLVSRVCGVRQNLYVYSLYRNPDLDDRILIVY